MGTPEHDLPSAMLDLKSGIVISNVACDSKDRGTLEEAEENVWSNTIMPLPPNRSLLGLTGKKKI